MKLIKVVPFVLVFSLFIGNSIAAEVAPFGLRWGMSFEQVENLGVELSGPNVTEKGIIYIATKLPKIVSDIESVYLYFGENDALYRIFAQSTDFDHDPYGNGVQNRYKKLLDILREKYGPGESYNHTDTELWTGTSEYIMGILQGRSWNYSNFNQYDVFVQLAIRATSGDSSHYTLIYENKKFAKGENRISLDRTKEAL